MFQKILLTLFFLCLSFSVSLAEKNATTLGFSLGGNHLTGLHFETYNRQHSYKFDIGTWNFQDISIGNQIKLYFKYLETSFYTGSGISFHLVFNNGFGYFVSLNLPLGIEWSLNNNSALGIGLETHYTLSTGSIISHPLFDKKFSIIPCFYYKIQW